MREILVDLERNRVSIVFRCNEDEAVIRLKLIKGLPAAEGDPD